MGLVCLSIPRWDSRFVPHSKASHSAPQETQSFLFQGPSMKPTSWGLSELTPQGQLPVPWPRKGFRLSSYLTHVLRVGSYS